MDWRWVPAVLVLACGGGEPDKPDDPSTTWTTPTTGGTDGTTGDSGGWGLGGSTTPEDTGPCIFPDVGLVPADPGPLMDTPQYMGLRLNAVGWENDLVDFRSPNNGDITATVDFVFYDAAVVETCIVRYDASMSLPVSPDEWPTDGGRLYAAWELELSGGHSTCGEVDPYAGFGSTDLRDWVESLQWGVGLGSMVNIESRLAEAVTDAGLNWGEDWAPYVFGFYVWTGDEQIFELGYTFAGAHDCGELEEVSPGVIDPLLEPLGPPMNDFYIGSQFFLFDLFTDPTLPTDTF